MSESEQPLKISEVPEEERKAAIEKIANIIDSQKEVEINVSAVDSISDMKDQKALEDARSVLRDSGILTHREPVQSYEQEMIEKYIKEAGVREPSEEELQAINDNANLVTEYIQNHSPRTPSADDIIGHVFIFENGGKNLREGESTQEGGVSVISVQEKLVEGGINKNLVHEIFHYFENKLCNKSLVEGLNELFTFKTLNDYENREGKIVNKPASGHHLDYKFCQKLEEIVGEDVLSLVYFSGENQLLDKYFERDDEKNNILRDAIKLLGIGTKITKEYGSKSSGLLDEIKFDFYYNRKADRYKRKAIKKLSKLL